MSTSSNTIYYRVLLNDRVKLEPKFICKNFKDHILSKLKSQFEGICSKHGYIKTDSIEIYKVAPGQVEMISLSGLIVYDVAFYAEVCNPLLNSVIKAVVKNVNTFGMLAEVDDILEIVIAKNSVNIQHDSNVNLDEVDIGDTITVQVIGKKFDLNSKKISIIGRVVSDENVPVTSKVSSKKVQQVNINEDELDVEDDIIDEDDEEDDDENPQDESESDEIDEIESGDENLVGGNEFFDSDIEDENDSESDELDDEELYNEDDPISDGDSYVDDVF